MTTIDAHQHFWRLDRGDYGWLTPDLAPLYRDYLPEDLVPLLRSTGIQRTILVQAAPTVAETTYLLRLADKNPFVAGVVGWAPLDAPDGAGWVERLHATPKLLGLRPMIQDIPDPAWMLRGELAPALAVMLERGLRFDALVKPHQLDALVSFVDAWPDLDVVIDHAGKPQTESSGTTWCGLGDWKTKMSALARRPRVHCKLSGLVTEACPGWTYADLRPVVDHLLETFGPSRLMFGSDWPVVTLVETYERWHAGAETLTAALSSSERSRVFGGTAAAFYGLKDLP